MGEREKQDRSEQSAREHDTEQYGMASLSLFTAIRLLSCLAACHSPWTGRGTAQSRVQHSETHAASADAGQAGEECRSRASTLAEKQITHLTKSAMAARH